MYSKKPRMAISRKVILILFDVFCFVAIASFYYAGTLIFSQSVSYPPQKYVLNCVTLLGCMFLWRFFFQIYVSVWRYSNTSVYLKMIIADGLGGLCAVLISRIFIDHLYHDVWMFVILASLSALMVLSSRLSYRLVYQRRRRKKQGGKQTVPVAIVGAGQVGAFLVEELAKTPYVPMFFIERDAQKIGSRVAGLSVYPESPATIEYIKEQEISELFIAISNLDSDTAASLYERYRDTGCKIKIYDMPFKDAREKEDTAEENGRRRGMLHDFRIEDLLFRKALSFNQQRVLNYYASKRVLVTGGGGSIGSELCRQIAKCNPAQLIILDIYENNAYEIQQELWRTYGEKLNLAVEIASVRDSKRLDAVFARYKPDIVFHAAAHKHVPLMEQSGCEAIKNNVFGTYNTANAAEKHGVKKFILISTDKAVNPTNIMGASKRVCEMIVQSRTEGETQFAAVRFGNVLGSNGSVIPLFQRQIAEGGPVTITDKRIIRYFMTIPEAAQLVIGAGAMAKKGELFVLDMGKPVRIYDLAVNMIRLCGLVPEVDIEIKEIGLRPGEKLYEELLIKTEDLTKTENSMIFIEHDTPLSRREVEERLDILRVALAGAEGENGSEAVREALRRILPTFRLPEEVNRDAAQTEEMKQAAEEAPV